MGGKSQKEDYNRLIGLKTAALRSVLMLSHSKLYRDILVESLDYCIKNKRMVLYSYTL